MSETIYAIGDIHGQLGMLEDMLARIEADGGRDARIVFLGDYVDRGPDSKGVIDLLAQGMDEGRNWTCLKGNHDRMFEWFVLPPAPRSDPHLLVGFHWFHERIGGVETAASYDVYLPERIRQENLARELRAAMPPRHLRFLEDLDTHLHLGDLFFVHAGIRPGVPLSEQTEADMVWIREEFLNDSRDHGAFVVHGHSPVDRPDKRKNRLNLDTGAGYGRPLTTAIFEAGEIFDLTKRGRKRL